MKTPPSRGIPAPENRCRSRRSLLATAGTAISVGFAGCSASEPSYRLTVVPIGKAITSGFTWNSDGIWSSIEQRLAERITEQGEVTTEGFHLVSTEPGRPSYVHHDDAYYEISVTRGDEVTRERWLLWFDLVETQPPAAAETYTSIASSGNEQRLDETYGLSEPDVRIAETTTGDVWFHGDFYDLEGRPPKDRGHLFLRRSAEETDLVPEPPFDYAVYEFDDETRYARAVAETVSVKLTQFVHSAMRIGDSKAAYSSYLRDEYLETTFRDEELSSEQRSFLTRLTEGHRYEETAPLSDRFAAVLERIGVAETEEPGPNGVSFSDDAYFEYDDTYYEAELKISG